MLNITPPLLVPTVVVVAFVEVVRKNICSQPGILNETFYSACVKLTPYSFPEGWVWHMEVWHIEVGICMNELASIFGIVGVHGPAEAVIEGKCG